MIEFFVHGDPVAQGRPKFFRRGDHVGCYDPDKSKVWKKVVADAAAESKITPFEKTLPLALTLRFFIVRPKSIKAAKRPHPIVKPDLDNLAKAIKDALKGLAWDDDSQVCQMTAQKEYSDRSGVWIGVKELKA